MFPGLTVSVAVPAQCPQALRLAKDERPPHPVRLSGVDKHVNDATGTTENAQGLAHTHILGQDLPCHHVNDLECPRGARLLGFGRLDLRLSPRAAPLGLPVSPPALLRSRLFGAPLRPRAPSLQHLV